MTLSRRLDALARDGERFDRPIESDNRSGRTDQLSAQPRHMSEPGAKIEHAQTGGAPAGVEQQARCGSEQGRLAIQPGELVSIAAEHVCSLAFR